MPRKALKSGPIGNGWIEEKRTEKGIRYVAYWQKYVPDESAPMGRRKEYGGSHDLGPKVKHGEGLTSLSASKKKWLTICDAIMGRTAKEHPSEMGEKTFRWYTENVFKPDREPRWRETTKYTIKYYLETKLYPAFGDTPLKDMTDAAMQDFLVKLAAKYSRTVVQHCLLYLRAILGFATDEGVLGRNPARKLKMPNGIKREDRPYLSIAEYNSLLEALESKRDQIMVKLLYIGGLRRGELFAVRWGDFDSESESLSVLRQINRFGKEADVKTEASEGKISLTKELCADLNEWRKWCGKAKPDAFIFASRDHTPINHKNWLERVLKPAATKANIERITYHMFRRGLATSAHQLGVVDKNIQSQLRHADPNVTRKLYMREVPEEQKKAMELLSDAAKAGQK